jgi:Calpain family cysteine protease
MLDGGGGGGNSGPFHHYGPTEATVEAEGDDLVDKGGKVANVANDVYKKELEAAKGTQGPILAPITAANSKVYRDTIEVKDASVYAGGCVRKFGNAIGIHDKGIDKLNSEYWTAYSDNFGVADIDWEHDKAAQRDPEGAKADHKDAIAAAESALMADLKKRAKALRDDLDDEADKSAGMLNQGPSEDRMMSLFQSGDLPIMATQLFPGYDFSKLDMRKMLEELKRKGDLPPGVNINNVMGALSDIDKLLDGEIFGDDGPLLQQLLGDLKEMAPGSFDFIVLGLSDDKLRRLDEMATSDNPLLGLGHWGTIDFHSLFLANGNTATLCRLQDNWPSIEPDMSGVDAVADGDMPMPHWGDPPPGGLFGDDGVPSAADVDQGMVGNCWMQAKMAALAQEHPDWVTDHIRQNANGTITVTMYDDDGNAHLVTVTDQIPVDDNGSPVFSGNSGTGANWSTYYEKAFAVASEHGSDGEDGYGGTEGGWGADDAQLMTGNEADDIDDAGGFLGMGDHKDMNDIRERVENGESVVVGMNGDDPPDGLEDTYHGNHEYYVKGFTSDGKIILGNPWGSEEDDLIMTEGQFNDHCNDAAVINP